MSKNLTLKLNGEAFPNANDPIVLNNYKYSAKRMGNAPTITATVNYPVCLDPRSSESDSLGPRWSDEVYVEFRGERYFVKNIPSSSYDSASIMYTYTLTLEAERAVLDNIYFFNTVKPSDENDEYLSESATFSFFGSILEFIDRLNRSLLISGVGGPDGYNVVVDSDVVSEESLYESSQLYITDALKHAYEVYHIPYYYVGKTIHFGYFQSEIDEVLKYGADKSLMSIKKNNTSKQIVNKITGVGSSNNITYFYPNPTPKGFIEIVTTSENARFSVGNDMTFSSKMDLNRPARFRETVGFIVSGMKYSHNGTDFIDGNMNESFDAKVNNELWLQYKFSSGINLPQYTYIDCVFNYQQDQIPITGFYIGSKLELNGDEFPTFLSDGGIFCGNINPGIYTLTIHVKFPSIGSATSYRGSFSPSYRKHSYWEYKDNMDLFSLEDATITFSGLVRPLDEIEQISTMRIPVQSTLMPSRYRNSNGKDRWYVATNAANRDEEEVIYGDVIFENEYSDVRPREYIHTDDKIMPTIKEIVNMSGQRIDMFSAFAYDLLDNDEIYPDDYNIPELAGKYKHPYFFAKLRKLDGPNGFNLFDQAIAGGEMTISFTSGMVGGCSFTIGVDETSQKNLVQVYEQNVYDSNGNIVHARGSLKRDPNTGDVLSGYGPNGGSQKAQEIQNNTIDNEVWIALRKEDSTFGVLMPNAENKFKPSTDDTFVILNIDLPDGYVISAEKKLEQELIKYMADNNSNKFSFSVVLSSIFFEDTPSISNILNENSKVTVSYNDELYPLYVSSYSYNMSDNSPLPEVSIELNDEIKVIKGALEKVKNEFKFVLGPTVDAIDIKLKETSNSLSNTNRIARVANETATAAKTSSDELKVEVKGVSAVASDAKTSAESAKLSADQAKEGVTAVGNEVGSLKTTVTSAQNIASNAQLTADNAMSEIGRVSNETSTKFNSVDNSINGIERDVNALEGLIGDEYNIWFENEGQRGNEPTLNNYPASDWTSDDDYFNHDKDLYYSITLGRAWRFMYNEGEPFWEEITDADTITALTKAREALDKANEAINAVEDVKYLTDIFGDTQVENSHAATLSTLIAVTDDNDNVTAGMYGGGVENLNNNGYKSLDHNAILMMFAGSTNLLDASNAPFRVYSDGCMYANHGTFGGVLKRSIKELNKNNLSEFSHVGSDGYLVIDLDKTGTFISIDFAAIRNLNIRLPWYSSDETGQSGEQLDDVLSLLGTEIIVKFSNFSLGYGNCFQIGILNSYVDPETQKVYGYISQSCLAVERSSGVITLKCAAGSNDYGIDVGWEIKYL